MISATGQLRERARRRAAVRCDRRLATILIALLALLWQGCAVQAHVHPGLLVPPADYVAHGPATAELSGSTVSSDAPATCPFCHELQRAASFLSPVAATAPALVTTATRPGYDLPAPWPARHEQHGWQSRGPPAAGRFI